MPFTDAGGHTLEYEWIGPLPSEAPTLVFLHEGLGSVSAWRDFPARIASLTGCGALVYSRWGHGRSDPLDGPRPVRFMHDEALVTLPQLLVRFHIDSPILVGHSGGASIALIYAGAGLGPVTGLVLEAPHVFVEDIAVQSIAEIGRAFETTDLRAQLARYHGANVDGVFRGWNDIWLSPAFRTWNITGCLSSIVCPILVIQGQEDQYGTVAQLETIGRLVRAPVDTVLLAGCGHSPHRDRRPVVERLMAMFVGSLLGLR